MGSFINSQSDNEICEVLNKRFSDDVNPLDHLGRTYLQELRDFVQNTEDLFDGSHHLHRVFHRLAFSVTGTSVPKTPNSRLRWLFLLHGNLPPAVERAIRGQLTAILSSFDPVSNPAGGVDYVTFATAHIRTSTGLQFELFDRNSQTPTVLTDANNKSYCAIVLQCNLDQQLALNPHEPDPPPRQNGEKDIPASVRRQRRRRVARKAAKKVAKKVAKKSAKKVAKKPAKKSAKKSAKKARKGSNRR